jgi:hypothetical protein
MLVRILIEMCMLELLKRFVKYCLIFLEDLRLLAKETENWISFHIVRNVEYVKIDAKKECRRFFSDFFSLILKTKFIVPFLLNILFHRQSAKSIFIGQNLR